jgi:hypothetical protein
MEYDDATHTYTNGRVVVPSVTQLLAPACGFYTPGSAERGKKIHEDCINYIKIDKRMVYNDKPYLSSFTLWDWENNYNFISAEEIIEGNIDGMKYAGRYDILFDHSGMKILVDIKTGAKAKWHIAQIAAYALAVKPAQCLLLYLRNDTSYIEQWLSSADLVYGIKTLRSALVNHYAVS